MRIPKPNVEFWFWIAYVILGLAQLTWILVPRSALGIDIIWISCSLLVFWKPSQKLLNSLNFLWIVPLVMFLGWFVADIYWVWTEKYDQGGRIADVMIANGFALSWELLMAIVARRYVNWLKG